jgi:hypothetical protein
MLDRIHGKIVWECDGPKCHESIETETNDFNTARDMLAEADWETRQVGNEWQHVCSDCKAAEYRDTLK